MSPHDTPEAVEAMALGVERTFYSEAAAMLRRLHQRAVDAERERDEARADAAHTAEQLMQDILRARADALREAVGIANERGAWASNDLDADSLKDRLEANGRMDMAKEIATAILALIPKETPHD